MTQYKVRDIRIVFTFLSGILCLLAYRHRPSNISQLLIFTVLILMPLVLFAPTKLVPLFTRWMKVAQIIGRFNTKVLLMLMFIFIITPVGLLKRTFTKDPMQRQFLEGGTYWESYEVVGLRDKSRYEKQF